MPYSVKAVMKELYYGPTPDVGGFARFTGTGSNSMHIQKNIDLPP